MSYEKTLAFLVPGMPFNGETFKKKSLGGSETAALFLARELAPYNNVYVFSNTEETKTIENVTYVPINNWKAFAVNTPHDVSIVQRVPEVLNTRLNSKLNMLWLHDLGQKEKEKQFKGVQWNIDQYIAVSDYHRNQLIESLNLPEQYVWASRNGIDPSLFGNAKEKERDRHKIMYSARPERGLDRLLESVFPKILEQEPRAWLCIACYDNPTDDMEDFYKYVHHLAAQYGDRVKWLDPLTKQQLYREYETAGVYLYPTPSHRMKEFREVSCISAMECMASGLPFVSFNLGALPETLSPEAGSLCESDEELINETLSYMNNDVKWKAASKAGKDYAPICSWKMIAEEWDAKIEEMISDRNDNPHRLLRHFWKHSDIQAAKKVAEDNGIEWDFSDYNYNLHSHYNELEEIENLSTTRTLGRTKLLTQLLQEKRPGNKILDFGCAQGTMAYCFKEEIPELDITGVDISERQIEKAKEYEQEGLQFVQGDEDRLPDGPFDVAVVTEVLEHQREPWNLLNKIEKVVKDDGLVLISTPHGPWEFNTSERNHFWEFDTHDFKEMLVGKKEAQVSYQSVGQNKYMEEPLGIHIVSYKSNDKNVKPIDMERKVNLQCPKQTVGACIIAGPGAEKSLRLHLDSYAHLMDQLVVGDTGLSEEAKKTFREYGFEIQTVPNPLEQGFDVARNSTLEHIWTDWVFWLDTDEHLIEPEKIVKYIRENPYHSYGLHQHHFAIDTQFTPDMPVRLFRRRPDMNTGKQMQWWGAIHEHPELDLNEGPGNVVVLADVNIAHYGYLIESGRQERFWRNFPLLQLDTQRNPNRHLQKHFLCRDSVILAGYYLQNNGGKLTDQVMNLCEDAIALYQQYFLGKDGFANVNTKEYYDRALRILNRGVEADVNINFGEGCRYASRDDLEIEIKHKLDRELGE